MAGIKVSALSFRLQEVRFLCLKILTELEIAATIVVAVFSLPISF